MCIRSKSRTQGETNKRFVQGCNRRRIHFISHSATKKKWEVFHYHGVDVNTYNLKIAKPHLRSKILPLFSSNVESGEILKLKHFFYTKNLKFSSQKYFFCPISSSILKNRSTMLFFIVWEKSDLLPQCQYSDQSRVNDLTSLKCDAKTKRGLNFLNAAGVLLFCGNIYIL